MQAKIRSVTIHRRFASGDTDSCSDLFGVRHLPFTFVIFVSTVLYLYIPNPLGTMTQGSSQVAPRYLTGDKAGLQEFLAKFDVSTRFGRIDVLERSYLLTGLCIGIPLRL